jgi:hypothetical protein
MLDRKRGRNRGVRIVVDLCLNGDDLTSNRNDQRALEVVPLPDTAG